MMKTESYIKQVFEYLDALRESGETNMWGAAAYLQRDFGMDQKKARDYLFEWMDTFSKRHPA